jgi:DNA-binding transcriptional MerR regulator
MTKLQEKGWIPMSNNKAIPAGYMTVGQMAKKMDVTVRTLQYYDKEGVLKPSAGSEGGRRLYTYKDMVRYYQIAAMKYLGFSLAEIRDKLPTIDTPEQVYELLTHQEQELKNQMQTMAKTLESIAILKQEVILMKEVDWEKYAIITGSIFLKNDSFWLLKHMDTDTFAMMQNIFPEPADAQGINDKQNEMMERAGELQRLGHAPDSEIVQAFAADFWNYVMDVTKGNPELLQKMMEMGASIDETEWQEQLAFDKDFLSDALSTYLAKTGVLPTND